MTRGISAARAIFAGQGLAQVAGLLLGEMAFGLVYGLLGYWLFRWFELEARWRGSLETVWTTGRSSRRQLSKLHR